MARTLIGNANCAAPAPRARAAGPAAAEPLARQALSLGAAHACDSVLQFLLPVVLVRCLAPADFAQYRLLWLATGTVMAFATFAMPASLYYYLPRADAATRRLYINQTLVVLAAAGLAAAWALSPWNPWLPGKLVALAAHGALAPAFVMLWVVASLLDLLPSVDERVAWQARAIMGFAALRTVALSATAIATRALEPLLLALLAYVVCKLAVLALYVARQHGLGRPLLRWNCLTGQLRYAVPFGISGALYELRIQADQWIAAALFPSASFASFSVATVLAPLLQLCRRSVNYVFLPSMSRLQAQGDIAGALLLNSRANVLVGAVVFPLLAFAFAFAEDLVTVVYTATYREAAPVLRALAFGLAAPVVETGTIMLLLQQGAFVARLNAVLLGLSMALSWYAAQHVGLSGAALGSVAAIWFDRVLTLRRIARLTGTPLQRLQDWPALARPLAAAVLAAAAAWVAVEHLLSAAGPLARLAAGGALLGGAYCVPYAIVGWRASRNKR